MSLYSQSKAGNVFLASEDARRMERDNVISVSINPSNLRTKILRYTASWFQLFLYYSMLYAPSTAHTQWSFAGLSPLVGLEDSG